jgi:hypothetical protein
MTQLAKSRWCWNCRKVSDEDLIPAPVTDSVFTIYVCKKCYARITRLARIALIIIVIFIIVQAIILYVF